MGLKREGTTEAKSRKRLMEHYASWGFARVGRTHLMVARPRRILLEA